MVLREWQKSLQSWSLTFECVQDLCYNLVPCIVGRGVKLRSHLGNNGVLAEAVSINQEGVTVRFGKICIARSTFWLLGVNIGNALASGADLPPC